MSALCGLGKGFWHAASSSKSSLIRDGFMVKVDNEILKLWWDVDSWEEVRSWRVNSSGGCICWVLTTGDISSNKMASVST